MKNKYLFSIPFLLVAGSSIVSCRGDNDVTTNITKDKFFEMYETRAKKYKEIGEKYKKINLKGNCYVVESGQRKQIVDADFKYIYSEQFGGNVGFANFYTDKQHTSLVDAEYVSYSKDQLSQMIDVLIYTGFKVDFNYNKETKILSYSCEYFNKELSQHHFETAGFNEECYLVNKYFKDDYQSGSEYNLNISYSV